MDSLRNASYQRILPPLRGGGNGNSEALAFPRDSLVLVALTNTGGADLEGLLRAVRRQLLRIPQPVVTDLPMAQEEFTPLLGTYIDIDRQDRIVVYERGGRLFVFGGRLLKQADGSFFPEQYRDWRLFFRIENGVGAVVTRTAFGVVKARARRRP